MYRADTPIIMLPGLGMDARMVQPQSKYFPNSFVMKLPECNDSVSLAAYAEHVLLNWPKHLPSLLNDKEPSNEIGDRKPTGKVFLAGIAFGGMVALEIVLRVASLVAQQVSIGGNAAHQIAGILLIGSTRSHTQIPLSFRMQEKVIARVPASIGRIAMKRTISAMASDEQMTPEQKQILLEMAQEADWNQIRWGASLIAKWNRTKSSFSDLTSSSKIPIHQIHGRQDRSIKPPQPTDATLLLHGKHLINISMASEVNRWMEAIVRNYDLQQKNLT